MRTDSLTFFAWRLLLVAAASVALAVAPALASVRNRPAKPTARPPSFAARSTPVAKPNPTKPPKNVAKSACLPCGEKPAASAAKRGAKKRKAISCYPKDYVVPAVRRKLNAAFRDLGRRGIKPVVTSAWRSSTQQAKLHRCSNSRTCRLRHPGLYGANPPGQSLHEAGLAVDIAGIAKRSRHGRTVTSRGKAIIAAMRKQGFKWRYGLADPVHFEMDPRRAGYRSASDAIHRSQETCKVRLVAMNRTSPRNGGR